MFHMYTIHIKIYFYQVIFHYSLLQYIEYSSLCYTVDPCLQLSFKVHMLDQLSKETNIIQFSIFFLKFVA